MSEASQLSSLSSPHHAGYAYLCPFPSPSTQNSTTLAEKSISGSLAPPKKREVMLRRAFARLNITSPQTWGVGLRQVAAEWQSHCPFMSELKKVGRR